MGGRVTCTNDGSCIFIKQQDYSANSHHISAQRVWKCSCDVVILGSLVLTMYYTYKSTEQLYYLHPQDKKILVASWLKHATEVIPEHLVKRFFQGSILSIVHPPSLCMHQLSQWLCQSKLAASCSGSTQHVKHAPQNIGDLEPLRSVPLQAWGYFPCHLAILMKSAPPWQGTYVNRVSQKSAHGQSTLRVSQRGRVGTLLFSH